MSVTNIRFPVENIVSIIGDKIILPAADFLDRKDTILPMADFLEGKDIILSAVSLLIKEELIMLAVSLYCGIVLVICYDVLRIFRRVFRASWIRYILEDVIFGVAGAIYVFRLLLKYNYGGIRYYSVILILGVFILKEWLLGSILLDKIALIIKKIMNKVTWLVKKISTRVAVIIKKIIKKLNTLLKPLKNIMRMIKLKVKKVKMKR